MAADEALATEIRRLVEGYQVSQAIHVAVTLGIPDRIAAGACASDELAEATGTHPHSLYRLLRALASVDVLREFDGQRFELTPLGELLRSDVPASIAGWAAFIGRPYYWQAWAQLLHSIKTGENAFQYVHGTDVWAYRTNHPDESAIFDRAMTSLSRRSNAGVLAAYDFGRFQTVADVGGGNGALLTAVLAAHPDLRGVLADRCQIIGGSFFESVPRGSDGYVLRAVIHDWDDADSIRILKAVRRAIPVDGTLLLIERIVASPNEGRDAKFSDLNMLVGPGGQERTREEYAVLLQQSGLCLTRVVGAGVYSVIEAVPA